MVFSALLLFSLLLGFALSAWSQQHHEEEYDYVVIGGGTSGLVIANRLSEQKDVSVLVIEAGDSVFNNTNVTESSILWILNLGTSIDWQYQGSNQTYADGKPRTLSAGKAIGGSSTINGMTYIRAEDVQIDSWEKDIGNVGWNWKSLFPFYKIEEQFQLPTEQQVENGADYKLEFHGFDGHIKTGWTSRMENASLPSAFNYTLQNLGLPYNSDPNSGKMRGWAVHPMTVDATLGIRADAGRGYYWPYSSRPNLKMLPNTFANKILWSNNKSCTDAVATGVEVTRASGVKEVVTARKEVIISTGALRSPRILELSGIGNPSVLSKYNISVKVANPFVGEFLQDQTNTNLQFDSRNRTYEGVSSHVAFLTAADLFDNETASASSTLLSEIPAYAAAVAKYSNNVINATVLEKEFLAQHDLIFNTQTPIAEIVATGFLQGVIVITNWNLLPFARGNIHITSADPMAPAMINPNYFMFAFDMKVQTAIARYIRRMGSTSPLSDIVGSELAPGFATVPENGTDEQWSQSLKNSYSPNSHWVSSARMAPLEKGGVVNERLIVHGTKNVRISDASVLPAQVSGHLTSTLYAVAERVSIFIKEDQDHKR